MPRGWRDPSAFRADPDAVAAHPTRRQLAALVAVLAFVCGAVAIASYVVHPAKARAFDLFHGSIFLNDQLAPTAVDLANGRPTLRLVGADEQVGVTGDQTLGVVPLADHTLLLNRSTGEFNMVDNSGFVVKHDGGGVPLVKRSGPTSAVGLDAGGGQAYIVRTGATGGTDVYLVNQPTVESAINATGNVRPRASDSIDEPGSTAPGAVASADGNLWLLVGGSGNGGVRTIRELRVPPNSSAGATLLPSSHGSVGGAAAIGTASRDPGGAGPGVVGVASESRIELFTPGAGPRTVSYAAPAGLTEILPASNQQGRLAFLLQGSDGWYVMSVNADGTGLRPPTLLDTVPRTAKLAEPAASRDHLYTIDQNSGRLYQIGYDATVSAVPDHAGYPALKGEATDFGDAYVLARGPRVIYDSASHERALMVFTDGSHAPVVIQKSSAVNVNAAGGAEALTRANLPTGPVKAAASGPPKKAPAAVQPINPKINCKTVNQKPHIPVITSANTGSRTVTLRWNYPILTNQDCYPSTYVVSVDLLSNDAPKPPSSVRVQSQIGATISGLFPSTRYQITVTAYINGQGTASAAVPITTGPEGPPAPTDLAVSADASGNWHLSWTACGTVQQGCVQAQTWTVIPSFCDGRGVASPPDQMTVSADPSARRQPPAVYKGGDGLLGRGLQFVVQGTGDQGQAGAPSAKSRCVYSWSPPIASALRLSASQPADTALGGSARTNVTLGLGNNPVADVGGVGAVVTFRLTGGGSTQTKSVTFDGNATSLAADFGGVQAGAAYTASATVRAAHGGNAVSLPPVDVTTRANWPAMSLSPSCPQTNPVTCQLSVQINGLTSAQAHNERFDFDGVLQCGSTGFTFAKSGFDPAKPIDAGSVSQINKFFGNCTVSGQLRESQGTPAPEVFGGTVKNFGPTNVNLGAPARSGAGQGDFAVSWDNGTNVRIHYTGNADLRTLTQNWVEKVFAPDGTDCAEPDGQDMPDTTVHVDPLCVNLAGQGQWTVSISYQDTTDGSFQGPFREQLSGGPTGFQYCTPGGFQATWGGTDPQKPSIDVTQNGQIDGCGQWSYDLANPNGGRNGGNCPTQGGHGAPPVTLDVHCDVSNQDRPWQLTISWDGPAGPQSRTIDVQGTPPTSTPPPSSPPPSSPSS